MIFQNKNPAELMSVMNGDVSAISNLLGGTDLLGILKTVVNSYFSSSPYGPIIQQYATMFLESEQGRDMMDSGSDFMASVAESESGRRVLALAPQLLAAKDTQTMMEVSTKFILIIKQTKNLTPREEMASKNRILLHSNNVCRFLVRRWNTTGDCSSPRLSIQITRMSSSTRWQRPLFG